MQIIIEKFEENYAIVSTKSNETFNLPIECVPFGSGIKTGLSIKVDHEYTFLSDLQRNISSKVIIEEFKEIYAIVSNINNLFFYFHSNVCHLRLKLEQF